MSQTHKHTLINILMAYMTYELWPLRGNRRSWSWYCEWPGWLCPCDTGPLPGTWGSGFRWRSPPAGTGCTPCCGPGSRSTPDTLPQAPLCTDRPQITNIRTVEVIPPQDRKQKGLSHGIHLEICPLSTHTFGKLISIFQFNTVWLNDHEFYQMALIRIQTTLWKWNITAISNTELVTTLTYMINLWFKAIL